MHSMRRGFYILVVGLMVFSSGCATFQTCDDSWLGKDKVQHFLVGGLLGGATAAAGRQAGWNDGESTLAAMTITFSLGAGKELYDLNQKKTCWSWRDMAWNMAGALAGALVAGGLQ